MAAYAALPDVLARAGRLAGAWDVDSHPSTADLGDFLEQAANEINAALGAVGITPLPVVDAVAAPALLGLNADMALLLAIDATWPGARGSDDVKATRDDLSKRVDRALTSFSDEKRRFPAVAYLLALLQGGDIVHDAKNFWDEESDYGRIGSASFAEAHTVSPYVLPGFMKGMKL